MPKSMQRVGDKNGTPFPVGKPEELAQEILCAGAFEIRDVDNGEKPFLYSSGNWGPGYVNIKGLIGNKSVIRHLGRNLAYAIANRVPYLRFIAGNATGGMIPAWIVSEKLEGMLMRSVPFVYVRGARKKGGHQETITGNRNNSAIRAGDVAIVIEELVNFAETTCNSADALRYAGYSVKYAACILDYGNPIARESLKAHRIQLISLLTLSDLLMAAERFGTHKPYLIRAYRVFLEDPRGWQDARGLTPVEGGGTQ